VIAYLKEIHAAHSIDGQPPEIEIRRSDFDQRSSNGSSANKSVKFCLPLTTRTSSNGTPSPHPPSPAHPPPKPHNPDRLVPKAVTPAPNLILRLKPPQRHLLCHKFLLLRFQHETHRHHPLSKSLLQFNLRTPETCRSLLKTYDLIKWYVPILKRSP